MAASPVLVEFLSDKEKAALITPITAEEDKAGVLDALVQDHRPHADLVFHAGDTLGDLPGLLAAARLGGIGIAVNPNQALAQRLDGLDFETRKRIRRVIPVKGVAPDYGEVYEIIAETVKKRTGLSI